MNWFTKQGLLATSLLVSLGAGAAFAPASAQQAAAQAAEDEIVITGTRIRDPNLIAASPVSSVGSEAFAETGATRVEDLLNDLPMLFAEQSSGVSNGSTGIATADLRDLGPQRTLVLVDGRRLVPGTPLDPVADLNFIPGALVERVEVLTGGASAVYGADAVAGVVNFITKDDFEGIQIDVNHGFYQHNNDNDRIQALNRARNFPVPDGSVVDGHSTEYSVLLGGNFDGGKGNATAYATYRVIDDVRQASRDYSSCALNPSADFYACGGSGLGPVNVRLTVFPEFNTGLNVAGGTRVIDPVTGALRAQLTTDAYNFAPDNYYQRPDERYTLGANMTYEFNEHAEVYSQIMFQNTNSTAQIAASGPFASNSVPVPCDNPLLTTEIRNFICGVGAPAGSVAQVNIGRRLVEGGPRRNTFDYNAFRTVIGSRGAVAGDWTYDAYLQYGRSGYAEAYDNDYNRDKVIRALDVVQTANGPVCRSALPGGVDPACVPLNLFRPGGLTQAALNYISAPGLRTGYVDETVVSLSFTGSLPGLKSPAAESSAALAFGAEYRDQQLELQTDELYQRGLLYGQGGETLPVNGGYDVFEVFAETIVPVIEGKPGFELLSLELGIRASQYSTVDNQLSYKALGNWSPIDGLRFRGGYNRAARAPNINELFSPRELGLWSGSDPCAGSSPTFTAAQCARTGVTAAQYGNVPDNIGAFQYNQVTIGNPNLDVETADTYTLGFVYSPSFVPGLTVSVDYYDISVEDTIGVLGAQFTVNQCALTGEARWCSLVRRDAAGSLFATPQAFIFQRTENLGTLATSGVDINASYDFTAGAFGDMSLSLVGTWMESWEQEPLVGFGTYDCAGYYGTTCDAPKPEWRHRLALDWQTPWNGIGLGLAWRHVGEVANDTTSPDPDLRGNSPVRDRVLEAMNYLDLNGSVTVFDNYTLRAGVQNVLDEEPPLVSQASLPATIGNGNTFPGTYDALGRYIFINLSARF